MLSEARKKYIYLSLLPVFIIIAAIISSSYSRDSVGYISYFNAYASTGWGRLFTEMFGRELFFLILSKTIYSLGISIYFLFLVYAVISLSITFYLIDKHSKDKWLSLAYFCSYFFILHDCTQIRFGLAVAFVYVGLQYLAENKKLIFIGIVILSAVLFHNAILIFIIMLFFTSKKSLYWLLGMVAAAVLFYQINLNSLMLHSVGSIIDYFGIHGTRLNSLYRQIREPTGGLHLGIFSWHGLMIYFFSIVLFRYRNKFNDYERLCYNAFMLSIFYWVFLKDAMDLQVRFNDAFGFSFIFLIPYVRRWLVNYVSVKSSYTIFLLFFTAYLAKFIFYDKMIVL